ncbi:transcription antitermination factor NusB [Bosea sp. F3-2]|uniref:transcription antitermination factor NusB n=1 Tax=Bosea sp. F3-2 TaxID=2599640 RepID=UPI0011EED379|nr:transcription antitermination factor NusB [Bosea sp. F3-2]QEL22603.1 transcription antitermination factor NusB [Bosea sp. F3-2]
MSRAEKRRGARLSVVQALYEMEVGGRGVVEAMAEFEAFWIGKEVEEIELPQAEIAFFRDVLGGVVREQRVVDRTVDDLLAKNWPLKRVEAVVRAVLRAGAYELAFRKDVPARAVISEYVAVARAFYEGEEIGMVNAVLDRMARDFRADEFDAPAA